MHLSMNIGTYLCMILVTYLSNIVMYTYKRPKGLLAMQYIHFLNFKYAVTPCDSSVLSNFASIIIRRFRSVGMQVYNQYGMHAAKIIHPFAIYIYLLINKANADAFSNKVSPGSRGKKYVFSVASF